ncbi:odorant receptor Or1-like, partial [Bombus impatiens]|uniref:Odorant receptor Or1-like n=1 Tax=Bombus impatiens TaxID=132113 RepID=A0A6P8LZG1_BOMIM
MHVLRWTFKLFIASGYFLPPTLKSPRKRFLYNLYTVFVTLYLWSYCLTLILDICFNARTRDDLRDNFNISVAIFITSYKYVSLVLGRKAIINMLDLLKKKPFVPENNGEGEIHARYDNLIEMFPGWFPFDITSSWLAFSMTFLYQFLGLVIICIGVCIFDTLFVGLLLHICCQLEMLVYRLHNIEGHEIQSLKHCVWHHNKIFRFADMVNNFFNKLMFVQFVESTVSMCFTLYVLTDIEGTAQLIGWSTYMFAGIFQTFYFCWFGNAAKVK